MPDSPPTSPENIPSSATAPNALDDSASPRLGPLGPEDQASDVHWLPLARESVTAERIGSWIVALVLLALGAVVLATILLVYQPSGWWLGLWLGIYATVALGLVWAAHFLPAIAYRHTFYQLSEVGFEIRRGILWRSLITVPHSRVQHTDVAQGPLQRFFDLGKLIVYTAGTQNASVELNGLRFQTACELRDALIRRRESTDGV